MSDTTARFLELVAENGRLKLLKDMIDLFFEMMRAARKEVVVHVTVATALSDDQVTNLEEALNKFLKPGEKLIYDVNVDPNIIGGLITQIGDNRIDMSIKRKIDYYTDLITEPVDVYSECAK